MKVSHHRNHIYKGKLWKQIQIAEYFGVSVQTVKNWMTQYKDRMRPFPKPTLITYAYKLYSPKEVKSWGRDASKLLPNTLSNDDN